MTRDPARIDPIVDNLRRYWRANPDLRLGQIVVNAINTRADVGAVFYVEDDVTGAALAAEVATLPPEPVGEVEVLIDSYGQACYEAGILNGFPGIGAAADTAKAALLAWCRAKGGR